MSLDSFVDLPENIISETTGNGLLLKKLTNIRLPQKCLDCWNKEMISQHC